MIFLYQCGRSPLENFFFSRAVFMYHFSQHLLMPSFDYVLLIYLLLKVWFLFPLSCMNRFCFIAWKRKFIWCKGHLISFLYYAYLQFSLFFCNYSKVVIVEVKVRYKTFVFIPLIWHDKLHKRSTKNVGSVFFFQR